MTFTFGGSNNNQNPAPGAPAPAAGGGFTFGTAAQATAPAAPPTTMPTAASAAANTSSTFGTPAAPATATATPATLPAAAPQFGSTAAGGPAPATTAPTTQQTAAANTAAQGFGLPATGGPTPATAPASGPATVPTAASNVTPAFGATTTGGATPATGTAATTAQPPAVSNAAPPFGATSAGAPNSATATTPIVAPPPFGTPNPASTFTSPTGAPPPQEPPTMTVPEFDSVFPNERVWKQLSHLASKSLHESDQGAMAGQELVQQLQCSTSAAERSLGTQLISLQISTWAAPNMQLRQQLAQRPTVLLRQQGASLTQNMYLDVCGLADDLHVTEELALSLYGEASLPAVRSGLMDHTHDVLEPFDPSRREKLKRDLEHNVAWTARALYFYERKLQLRSLLMLLQNRLHPNGHYVVRATDNLLQNGLIKNLAQLIHDYTKRIDSLSEQLAREEVNASAYAPLVGTGITGATGVTKENLYQVHWNFAIAERQVAAECLFFLAYHAQLLQEEVVCIIDLVRELTNGPAATDNGNTAGGLKQFDPFRDVPNPYENPPPAMETQAWMSGFQSALPPLREKDPFVWQEELVTKACKSGQPQLLRCVSTLVTSLLCALDGRHTLVDRQTHQPNDFGSGNALLPPNSTSVDGVANIHGRLCTDRDVIMGWKRPDVLGLIMASYSMLLRSAHPAALSSPRSGPASPAGLVPTVAGSFDVRKTCRECLVKPAELKSFSFARLSLLPCLQMPNRSSFTTGSDVDLCEFLTSVLAEFSSHYLDVLSVSSDRPVSRQKWERDADEDLRLRRSHQEQNRHFQAWSGATMAQEEVVPSSVDLLRRPDCMDDVVAFAVAVCSLGPNYALNFWSITEDFVDAEGGAFIEGQDMQKVDRLVSSRAMQELGRQQENDASLSPSYLSFLAALALAESPELRQDGATVIHEMLSADPTMDPKPPTTWATLMDTLRWYARELNPEKRSSSASSSNVGTSAAVSTSYYTASDTSTTFGGSSSQDRSGAGDSASTRSSSRELGEENTYILLSHLALISNVASKSFAARRAVLSINLPIQDGRSGIIGQDSSLTVLFALASMPLSPEVRGSVFGTIARLLDDEGGNLAEKSEMREMALKAWEHVEAYQVLPIFMFDQYSMHESDVRSMPCLGFPPSSAALVRGDGNDSWIPANATYCSIVYEMEHIESSLGVYHSTEGFLRLLESLFRVGGWPSSVGKGWRTRPGCSAYYEYVSHLVLPRAMGQFLNLPGLPFRSKQDKCRFTALALKVVEVVLTRYQIPSPNQVTLKEQKDIERRYETSLLTAQVSLGPSNLAKAVTVAPTIADSNIGMEDFRMKAVPASGAAIPPVGQTGTAQATRASNPGSIAPKPKSPGFTALVDILSSTSGVLFDVLVDVLKDSRNTSANGLKADRMSLTFALFGSLPPSFASAKEGSSKKSPLSMPRQTLLKGLRPSGNIPSARSAVRWQEHAVLLALRALCATIAREGALRDALAPFPGQTGMVPVLRFQPRTAAHSMTRVMDMQLSKLSDKLLSSDISSQVLTYILDLVGYTSQELDPDVDIATASVAVIFYVQSSLSPQHGVERLCGSMGETRFAQAFAQRLIVSSGRCDSLPDVQLLRLILDRIAFDLRTNPDSKNSISRVMLGLPSDNRVMTRHSSSRVLDCFDACLRLVGNEKFVLADESSELASTCYEVFVRLCRLTDKGITGLSRIAYSAGRMRAVDFWKSQLVMFSRAFGAGLSVPQFLGNTGALYVIHSVAWLLKGVATELRLLMGLDSPSGDRRYDDLLTPHPGQCKELISLLFAPPFEILRSMVRILPIERVSFDDNCAVPPEYAITRSKRTLHGPPEVFQGYEVVDFSKLINATKERTKDVNEEGMLTWSKQWNRSASRDCASAHLSDAIHVVLACSASGAKAFAHHIRFDGVGCSDLLALILDRMALNAEQNRSSQMLDDVYYTVATRNLALSALAATGVYLSISSPRDLRSGNMNTPAAGALLARAVACSGAGRKPGPGTSHQNDRTVILGSALVLMLRALSRDAVEKIEPSGFLMSAQVLSKLAVMVDPKNPGAPPTEAKLARSCLAVLLDKVELVKTWASPRRNISIGNEIGEFVKILGSLDWGMASLLEKIALLPGGSDLLLNEEVEKALLTASQRYRVEESRIVDAQTRGVSNQQVVVGTPAFLIGHLELMSTIMASRMSEVRLREFTITVMNVLCNYSSAIKRLASSFPVDGDVVRAVVRCMAQLKVVRPDGRTVHSATNQRVITSNQLPSPGFEGELIQLVLHIGENPLPPFLLPSLPSPLENTHNQSQSHPGIVPVAKPTNKCWWDALDLKASQPGVHWSSDASLASDIYGFCSSSIDLLRDGLRWIQGMPSTDLTDGICLSRALCRCVDSSRLLATQVRSTQGTFGYPLGSHRFPEDQWKSLQSKLHDVVELLLLLSIRVVRRMKDYKPTELRLLLVAALDYTRMDVSGIGLISYTRNENLTDTAVELARVLRKDLETI